jgi:hypothetical protein
VSCNIEGVTDVRLYQGHTDSNFSLSVEITQGSVFREGEVLTDIGVCVEALVSIRVFVGFISQKGSNLNLVYSLYDSLEKPFEGGFVIPPMDDSGEFVVVF